MKPAHTLAVIWKALTFGQRRRFVLLQFVSLLMAMSTVAGLAAVMAFLAVLADPTLVDTHPALNGLWRMLQTTRREFIVSLGAAFIALLIASAMLNVLGSRVMGRFAYSVGDRIREVLFLEYLHRDYLFHARVGAGQLTDNVLIQADRVTVSLLHGQQLVTNAVLTLLVVGSIAAVNPQVAAAGVLGIAGGYLLFYRAVRTSLGRQGRLQAQLSFERLAVVEQSFRGIKYLLVTGAQQSFGRRLATITRTLSQSFADTLFVAQMPRYVLECVAGAGLIACAAFVSGGANESAWLAQLSFIGFAGFRLLPAFQQMYHAFVIVRSNRGAVENIAAELSCMALAPRTTQPRGAPAAPLVRGIELTGVSFRYGPDSPAVLADASLSIPAGAAIGIVGASGCGKTTLVDLILGLLLSERGRIEVDGKPLDSSSLPEWRQRIGYVPQDPLILDDSVRANIAFGVAPDDIDDARVHEVAREAGAAEFIESLAEGYATKLVGVGAGLSGGQRQRIAIARALYHDPALLVLDEATNALDSDTERAVIDAVVRNRGARTVLVVAHGLALIDACDRVYELRGGSLHLRDSRPIRNYALRTGSATE
jgi:ATP-binding cassette, subfamily B, bacterial PglK